MTDVQRRRLILLAKVDATAQAAQGVLGRLAILVTQLNENEPLNKASTDLLNDVHRLHDHIVHLMTTAP